MQLPPRNLCLLWFVGGSIVDSPIQLGTERSGCFRTVSGKLHQSWPKPRAHCRKPHKLSCLKLAVSADKATHRWHSEIALIRNCLHRHEAHTSCARASCHCGGFHIDGLRAVSFGELHLSLDARNRSGTDQYARTSAGLDDAAVPGIDDAAG